MVGSLELLSSWGGATWEKARETGKVNCARGSARLHVPCPLLPHLLGGEGGLSGIFRCPTYSYLLPLLLRQGLMPLTLESEDGAPSILSPHSSNENQSLSWQIHPHPTPLRLPASRHQHPHTLAPDQHLAPSFLGPAVWIPSKAPNLNFRCPSTNRAGHRTRGSRLMPSPGPRGSGEKHHRVVGTHWSRQLPGAGGGACRGLAGRREQEARGKGVVVEQAGVQLTAKDSKAEGPLRSSWLPPPPPHPRRPINSRWKDHITGRGYLSPHSTPAQIYFGSAVLPAWPVCRLLLGKGEGWPPLPARLGPGGHQGTHSGVGSRGPTQTVSKQKRLKGLHSRPSWWPLACPLGPGQAFPCRPPWSWVPGRRAPGPAQPSPAPRLLGPSLPHTPHTRPTLHDTHTPCLVSQDPHGSHTQWGYGPCVPRAQQVLGTGAGTAATSPKEKTGDLGRGRGKDPAALD